MAKKKPPSWLLGIGVALLFLGVVMFTIGGAVGYGMAWTGTVHSKKDLAIRNGGQYGGLATFACGIVVLICYAVGHLRR